MHCLHLFLFEIGVTNNIFYFRLYTSIPLANFLLNNSITIVGTVNKNRRGVPEHMKNVTGRPDGDYKILYEDDGKISLHSWTVKPKKGIKCKMLSLPLSWVLPLIIINFQYNNKS